MKRVIALSLAALAAMLLGVVQVAAQNMSVICSGLAGCGDGLENTIANNVLPGAVSMMIQIAAGGSVVFIVIAGTRLTLAYGDDAAIGTARKNIMYALGGLGLSLVAAALVSFVTSENYGQSNPYDFLFGGGGLMDSVVRIILVLFNAGFVVMIVLGGFRMLLASGSADEFKKGGGTIKLAIIGAVIVNLARAIVQAFLNLDF